VKMRHQSLICSMARNKLGRKQRWSNLLNLFVGSEAEERSYRSSSEPTLACRVVIFSA
jgi:hypothetical protein